MLQLQVSVKIGREMPSHDDPSLHAFLVQYSRARQDEPPLQRAATDFHIASRATFGNAFG
jgi:hypothetical protein